MVLISQLRCEITPIFLCVIHTESAALYARMDMHSVQMYIHEGHGNPLLYKFELKIAVIVFDNHLKCICGILNLM